MNRRDLLLGLPGVVPVKMIQPDRPAASAYYVKGYDTRGLLVEDYMAVTLDGLEEKFRLGTYHSAKIDRVPVT
jgi:hypothetical protein